MVSIIVCSRNRKASLARCLASILAYTDCPYEIIISDTSTDTETLDYLKELPFKVIYLPSDTCYSAGVNAAIKEAKGKYLTIPAIANDIEVTPGWLSSMVNMLENNPNVGMGVFSVFRPGNVLECYGAFVTPERYNGDPEANPQYAGYGLVPRKVYEKVGDMDENFKPIYCEDVDYGLRIWQAGYICKPCPTSKIIHHFDQTHRHGGNPENLAYLKRKHNL